MLFSYIPLGNKGFEFSIKCERIGAEFVGQELVESLILTEKCLFEQEKNQLK